MAATSYPYTTVPGKLREVLSKAPSMGKPARVTQEWLKQAGWTSSNDRSMIPVLKFVGLVGSDGRPTQLWEAIRIQDQTHRAEFAAALRKSYSELFMLYPDAHRKDAEALRNFFRAHTSGGDQVQSKLVQTFQVLADFADFDTPALERELASSEPNDAPSEDLKRSKARRERTAFPGVTLTINIQLQLPATSDGDIYDTLFRAMREHLMELAEG